MIRCVFWIVTLLWVEGSKAQVTTRLVGSGYWSCLEYSDLNADAPSFSFNVASITHIKDKSVAVYSEQRFLLKEMVNCIATAVIPSGPGQFGFELGLNIAGAYKNTGGAIGYGRALGKFVDAGLRFTVMRETIDGYGSNIAIGFDLDWIIHLTEKIHAGFGFEGIHMVNSPRSKQSGLPKYQIGLGFDIAPHLYAGIHVFKDASKQATIESGFHYAIDPKLYVRFGISSFPTTAWMGTGINLKALRLDIIFCYHPLLGVTPGMAVSSTFKSADLMSQENKRDMR